jgi:hypothetical protein
MCIDHTSAKIRKAVDERRVTTRRKKISFVFSAPHLFLPKFFQMEMQRRNKGLYLILFLVAVALTALAIATHWPWLTLILPFVFTFFVLAMGII